MADTLGEVLADMRTRRSMSQDTLKDLSGVSQASISLYENNQSVLFPERAKKLLDAMDATPEERAVVRAFLEAAALREIATVDGRAA